MKRIFGFITTVTFTSTALMLLLSSCTSTSKSINVDLSSLQNAISNIKKVKIYQDKNIIKSSRPAAIISKKKLKVKSKKYSVNKIAVIKKNIRIEAPTPIVISKTEVKLIEEKINNKAAIKFEINNSELIGKISFKVISAATKKNVVEKIFNEKLLANTFSKLAAIEKQEKLENKKLLAATNIPSKKIVSNFINDEVSVSDIVKTVQAAKLEVSQESSNLKKEKDELVVFDYSEPIEKPSPDKALKEKIEEIMAAETPTKLALSSSVNNVISRLMQNKKPTVIKKNDYLKNSVTKAKEASYASETSSRSDYSLATISAYSLNFNSYKSDQVFDIEFIPDYDRNDRIMSNHNGEIKINSTFNTSIAKGHISGTIVQYEKIRTNIDLSINSETTEIPMLDKRDFSNFLDSKQLNAIGGFVLLEVENKIADVDIDTEYEARFFLSEAMKLVKRTDNYNYILYVGVSPGNTLIKYLFNNNNTAERIVHIVEDEVTFERPIFNKAFTQQLEFRQRKILGSSTADLQLEENQIRFFNRNLGVERLSLNSFKVEQPKTSVYMRRYLEITNLEDSIFVGINGASKVELPSQEFIEYVLDTFDIEGIQGRCIIQINSKDKIYNLQASGRSISGTIGLDIFYLDSDGKLQEEVTQKTEKAFIMGDNTGVIGVAMGTLKGTTRFFQTVCSDSTYLVEQF